MSTSQPPTPHTTTNPASATTTAPRTTTGRLRMIGPGIVLALASVGASDMITTLNSGAEYGLALIWVFTVGIILKFVLSEAVARLQMTGDRSLMQHMTAFGGPVFPALFLIAEILVALFFGASVVSVCTVILQHIFPVVPYWPTALLVLASAAFLLFIGKYSLVEKAMMGFGVLMFFGIVTLAVTASQGADAAHVTQETLMPVFPGNSIVTVASLIGGVGGATGILAYSAWIREKQWRTPDWLPTIRLDLTISYAVVLVFAVAMTAVGGFILYGQGFTISDNDAVFTLSGTLGETFGDIVRLSFLLSFFAVVYTSVLGGFSGICYVGADCLRVLVHYRQGAHLDTRTPGTSAIPGTSAVPEVPSTQAFAKSWYFRLMLVYMVAATPIIMTTGKPVSLVLIYAAISSFILPVLSLALLFLLRKSRVGTGLHNKPIAVVLLVLCLALFGFLCVLQLQETYTGFFSGA